MRQLAIMLSVSAVLLAADSAQAQTIQIVALGASQTEGKGLSSNEAWPAVLETMLRAKGYDVRVRNAGVSGDTTPGMLNRLGSAIPQGTQLVIVESGLNDQIARGKRVTISADETANNVDRIVSTLRSRNIKVVLCQKKNLGANGPAIARKYGAVLATFCVDGKNLGSDGYHMSVVGQRNVAAYLLPIVISQLGRSR